MPLEDAQKYSQLTDAVTSVSLKVSDVLNATQIVREAGNTLDVYVYLRSWQQEYGFCIETFNLLDDNVSCYGSRNRCC